MSISLFNMNYLKIKLFLIFKLILRTTFVCKLISYFFFNALRMFTWKEKRIKFLLVSRKCCGKNGEER